ncbi:hypothetical protein A5791_13855 [Mycobacterium sp. 852002-51163_SCH5372311]|uniref:hypothetical protein n=1 Tax=Mycobacterium sp. 852002-51163_SCH5372311 TaxID=1834097 RepID=UPI0007FCD1B0|nr:hypothetical protein [Mycobacterium sp. 852002-51163_SCH5372311]OBF92937.1 hypothetical protein A5791_13855 [Mycobacterium sp. 852002-51163_SCH5372311]
MADKKDTDKDAENEASPGTEAFVPDFDTGEPSVAFVPDFDDDSEPFSIAGLGLTPAQPKEPDEVEAEKAEPSSAEAAADSTEAPLVPVTVPVTVPGRYQYLKWWKLIAVIFGVWCAAGVFGLGVFYWWFHTVDKTWPVFVVLVYVVACSVAGVLLAMVQGRPLISALSLAVMSGPFASVAAAAPLYGYYYYYYCERTGHCLLSVIPY